MKDGRSEETLIAANVYLVETQQGAITNNSGYFTITDLQPGTYTLTASYIGYRTYERRVTLKSGENYRYDMELEPAVIQGEEVVVEAEKTIEEEKQIGVQNVQPLFIKELPSVLEADVFRSIQLLPGIKAASDFSSGLYIRGGSPDQTLILLDRTSVYNPSHFFGFFSTFNPDAIKDVRVFKGGYPSEYGGRLGSVVDIYNRDGNRKEFQGKATLGLLASRLNLEAPYRWGSWMVAMRRSTLEPLLSALRESGETVPNTFYFYDFNSKINVDITDNDRLNLSAYFGRDKVKFPFAEDAEFNLGYGNRTFSANWTHVFNQKLFSNFTGTASRYKSEPDFIINSTPFEQENSITDYSLKGDLEYIPNNRFQTKAGFWTGHLELVFKNRFDNTETFSNTIQSAYAQGYFEQTWKPSPLWIVKGGSRVSYFDDGDYLKLEPRLSLEHVYNQQLLFQAAVGRYYQYLTLITNEAFSGFDTWLTAADGVSPSHGDQFVLGFKSRPTDEYNLDMEVYYRTMRNLFEFDPRIQDLTGLEYEENFRFGRGYAYGFEVFFEKKRSPRNRLDGFIAYTWGTTRRKFAGFNEDEYYPPKYDRIHDLNVVSNYYLGKKWRFTAVFSYATGQAYTNVLGNYSLSLPTGSDDLYPFVVGKLNRARLPAYHRLDIGFTKDGKFFGLGNYQLQLQLINAYSRRNVWFYSFDLSENPIKRDTVQMLPIIPNISFTLDF
ncbi:MAG: TonB-dependent receptor [Calditrichaeota bacterium]|nr:TonB-dependent receptor [Calditrichota bacterium]